MTLEGGRVHGASHLVWRLSRAERCKDLVLSQWPALRSEFQLTHTQSPGARAEEGWSTRQQSCGWEPEQNLLYLVWLLASRGCSGLLVQEGDPQPPLPASWGFTHPMVATGNFSEFTYHLASLFGPFGVRGMRAGVPSARAFHPSCLQHS